MSRTYRNGQKWRAERSIRRERDHRDDDSYPTTWRGHVFENFDEYAEWYLRQYTSGKITGMVYDPWRDSPKGYRKYRRCTCCGGYDGPNKWWRKRRTAKLNRLVAQDNLRRELFEMLDDGDHDDSGFYFEA